MPRATDLAHLLLRNALKEGDWVIDATVGNGHDTLWLAQCVGPSGRVFGFDVQRDAIAATEARVHDQPQVTLFHVGHEHLAAHLPPDAKGRIAAVMFNLGFLPGASKTVTTRAETTIVALEQAMGTLTIGGHITLVLYPGHADGATEAAALRDYARQLPGAFVASHFARLNALRPAPELLMIERFT